MDLAIGFPKTQLGLNSLCVIMDRLTKPAHFFQIKETYRLDKLVDLYIREIVKLHGRHTYLYSVRYGS